MDSPPILSPRSIRPLNSVAVLIALLLLKNTLVCQVKEIRFERIPLERGSADYRAFDVAQDSVGFLWFATSNGLYRYDGIGYRIYRPHLNDTAGISSNAIWCLTTDREGKLWVGTFDGVLECYDPLTDSFIHYKHYPADQGSISGGPITAVLEDHTGALWIGTETHGLNKVDKAGKWFEHYVHDPRDPRSLCDNTVTAIAEDAAGNIWIGTSEGLCELDRRSRRFTRYTHKRHDPQSLSDNAVSCLLCDRSGNLWAGTGTAGINRFDRSSGGFIRYGRTVPNPRRIPCDSITSIFEYDQGQFWIGTLLGVVTFDTHTGNSARYLYDPLNLHSVSSNYIRRVRGDRAGTIWIAADQDGRGLGIRSLNKVARKAGQFIHIRLASANVAGSAVLAFYHEPTSDAVWIGTMGGLRRFNTASGRTVEYTHNRNNPASVSSDIVSAICVDRSGATWVGTWGDGLDRLDQTTGRFSHHGWDHEASSPRNAVMSISQEKLTSDSTRRVSLWIGAFMDGILHFSAASGKFVHYRHDPADPLSLSNNRVLSTCVDRRGTLWIGTDGGGLDRFDPTSHGFIHFAHSDTDPVSLRSNRVYSICEEPLSYSQGGEALWVGTATGLDLFDVARRTFTHYTLLDSTSAIGIVGIIATARDMWITTDRNGLFRLSPESGRWRNYSSEDGLHSDIFTRACCAGPAGELYLGDDEGFTVFHPDSIRDNAVPPPVVLTSFSVFEKPFRTERPLWARPLIHLNYDQDFFSFQYYALDFTDPHKNQFAYRLEGFEEEWNHPGARNFAGYTKVDPGRYTFSVKGSNSDGVWNEAGASVDLVIEPPYWRTWWFRMLVAATFLSAIAGAYNYRVAKLLELERMRVRIASDLHDDIGSSLSGIAMITDSLRTRLPLGEQDRKRLGDVTDAARRTADALRDIVWIVNPEHDKLDDILLRMKDATANLLAGTPYTLTCNEKAVSGRLGMEFRRNLLLLYKEILNNIVRHACARSVNITIGEEEGILSLEVVDDGVGFDPSCTQRGNGLTNLSRRAEQIGGTVRVESRPGHGTRIEFKARIS